MTSATRRPGSGSCRRPWGRVGRRMSWRSGWRRRSRGALADHGLKSGRIGLDVAQPGLQALLERRGYTVDAGAGAALAGARAIKTADEVECLRLSAAVCEAGFQAMREAIVPGARESEVFARGVARIIELGGEHGGGNISSGPNTWPKSQADTTRPGHPPRGRGVFGPVQHRLPRIPLLLLPDVQLRRAAAGDARRAHSRAVENLYAVLEAIAPGVTTAEAGRALP